MQFISMPDCKHIVRFWHTHPFDSDNSSHSELTLNSISSSSLFIVRCEKLKYVCKSTVSKYTVFKLRIMIICIMKWNGYVATLSHQRPNAWNLEEISEQDHFQLTIIHIFRVHPPSSIRYSNFSMRLCARPKFEWASCASHIGQNVQRAVALAKCIEERSKLQKRPHFLSLFYYYNTLVARSLAESWLGCHSPIHIGKDLKYHTHSHDRRKLMLLPHIAVSLAHIATSSGPIFPAALILFQSLPWPWPRSDRKFNSVSPQSLLLHCTLSLFHYYHSFDRLLRAQTFTEWGSQVKCSERSLIIFSCRCAFGS